MNKNKYLFSLLTLALLTASSPVLAGTTAEGEAQIQTLNQNISSYLANRMGFVTSLGMNDATAASTNLLFVTVGISGGLAVLDNPSDTLKSGVSSTVTTSGIPLDAARLPWVYSPTIFGRVGIPLISNFDVGVKYGIPISFTFSDATYKNSTYGGELRYSILKQGILIPGVSIATGVDHSSGSLSYKKTLDLGTINGSSFKVTNLEQSTDWSMTNFNATVRVGVNVLVFSLLGGLQAYVPTGDVTTKATGTLDVGGTSSSLALSATNKAPSLRTKGILGAYLNLPFFRFGGQYDVEFNSGIWAAALTAQFVF